MHLARLFPESPREFELSSLPFLNASDVALRLGMSPEAIRRLAREGKIPAYRVGRRALKFDPAELKAWLNTRKLEASDA
jgi:excisionase family DNA binding protein